MASDHSVAVSWNTFNNGYTVPLPFNYNSSLKPCDPERNSDRKTQAPIALINVPYQENESKCAGTHGLFYIFLFARDATQSAVMPHYDICPSVSLSVCMSVCDVL